jgi:general secretion pathway protein D
MFNRTQVVIGVSLACVVIRPGGLAPAAPAQQAPDLSETLFGGSHERADAGQRIAVVEFPDADITDILKIVSDNSGWSIFASKGARVKVSLSAKNITARELLDKVVAAAGLVYHEDKNINNVMTFDEYAEAFGLAKQVISLRHAPAADAAQIIAPFLTKNGKVSIQDTGNRLVLLDTQANLVEIARVLTTLDEPSAVAQVEVVRLAHRDAAELVAQVSQYCGPFGYASARPTAASPAARQTGAPPRPAEGVPRVVSAPFAAFADVQTNSILLVGAEGDRKVVKDIIMALDTLEVRTIRTYPIQNTDAQEVYDALEKLFQQSSGQRASFQDDRGRKVALSRQTNAVTVFGTPDDQIQAESLVRSMDIPIPEGPARVRVYMLENTNAEAIATLLAGLTGGENTSAGGGGFQPRLGLNEVTGITSVERAAPPSAGAGLAATVSGGPPASAAGPWPGGSGGGAPGAAPASSQPSGYGTALLQRPRIAANSDTNSVVVWAAPADQQNIEQIIRQLDRRRPQVLIEAILVELTVDDDFTLGIELESWQPGTHGETTTLFYTAFGLSTIDPNTGQRTLIAQPGMGAAILRPDEVPFVIQALQTTGKASIHSYPKVLVNDNAQGLITSVREEPYTQVNASTTVATTSFGGYIQAGIQFGVIPHISENNFLRLEYQVQLNSFVSQPTVTLSGTLPPARDTNTVQSEVTVPDNYTIIIGGLRRKAQSQTVRKVPLLGDIPAAGYLFQSLNKAARTVTLYFFLRPQILRDDRFLDLKLISDQQVAQADIHDDWPRNPAVAISNMEAFGSWQNGSAAPDSQPESQPAP